MTRSLFAIRTLFAACAVILCAASASAQNSWGIGVSPSGVIYFCDSSRNVVWRIAPTGERTPAMTGVTCRAIVSSRDGFIIGETTPGDVSATKGVGIWQFDRSGARQWVMRPTTTPEPGTWLVRDRQGTQYSWGGAAIGSQRSEIVKRDALGILSVAAGSFWGSVDGTAHDANFGNIAGFALAPDGSLVIADSGNIRRMAPTSEVRTEALRVVTDSHLGMAAAPGLWAREMGVATDHTGAAVVVDPEAGRIVHVDRQGRATSIWEPAGFPQRISGGRWGWRPAGVAMMGRTYYVLDQWMGPSLIADLIGSPRLSQVDDHGRVTRIATISEWTVRAAAGALIIVLLSLIWTRIRRR